MDVSEKDSGRWCCPLLTFPNSPSWWRLISSVFLTRTSCHKTAHANRYYGAWPGWAVSVSVLPLTRLHVPIGVIRLTQSPFNSPTWLDKKPNSTWYMTVDYREFNKLIPHICVRVPNTARVLDTILSLKTYHCVLDFSNAFLRVPFDRVQCAFTWEGRQWTFTVLPHGYPHSPTIWMVAQDFLPFLFSVITLMISW